ncbi:MAG: GH3 auxin-responsive promoter family protein [Bacteroidota bacterium]
MPILGSIIKNAIELKSKMPRTTAKAVNPHRVQRRTLRKLIRKSQFTLFGKHFEFTKLFLKRDIIKAFQESVPIFEYNSIYRDWWSKTHQGEMDVCWPGKIKYFALSSGTSEASSKYIPVTSDMLRAIKKTSTRQIFSLAQYDFPNEFFEKGILILGGSTHLHYNGKYFEGDLSGITAKNIPFWFQHFYKPGRRISKERDWSAKLEEIVKKAPKWDIGVIAGVPAWIQILLLRITEYYNLKSIHEIWPNLSIFVHGGVAFEPYRHSFEKILSKPIEYIETYLASEGFIAYQTHKGSQSMQLVLDNGLFFEFIPFNEDNFDGEGNLRPNPRSLSIKDIEENTDYALLISSCAGAWRYLIGDTVRFTSKKESEIVITGRTKLFLSLCGEHVSLDNLNVAIQQASKELQIEILEFSVAGVSYQNMFAHHWFVGTNDKIDPKVLSESIDQKLKTINDDYRVERLEAIREVLVDIIPVQYFYDWMKLQGKEGGQNKFPRVLKGEKLKSWTEFLTNQN